GSAGMDPAGARAEAEKEMVASMRRDQALYENIFNTEAAGPEARRLQSVLQRAMSEPGVIAARHQPESTRIECKNTQCRVTAVFAPSQDPSEWSTRLAIAAVSHFASNRQLGSEEPGGGVSRVLYFYPQSVDPRLRDPVRGITR
ncbi:MAG TPA: hypothetical protein VNM48_15310, partial [Chloroflexota bacterium]|nr:hypothetical protein [Chloroflexota bacterium]